MSCSGSTWRPTPAASSEGVGLVRMRPSGSSTTEQSAAAASASWRSGRAAIQPSSGIGPLEAHLVAREEVAQAVALGLVRAADHDREAERAGRLRLEALDALLDGRHEACAERLGRAHEQAELGALEARDAQRRDGAGAGEERRAEDDRQLAEVVARLVAHRDPPGRRRDSAS